jgi:phage gp36-like protein
MSAFLIPADYTLQIRTEILNLVTDTSPLLQAQAEAAATAEMQSYLRGRFDVVAVFNPAQVPNAVAVPPVPDTRNPQIVMYLVDMVLYHLHSRQNPRNVPTLRQDRYEQVIDWLKTVRRGGLSCGLPLERLTLPDGTQDTGSILPRGSSILKQTNTY